MARTRKTAVDTGTSNKAAGAVVKRKVASPKKKGPLAVKKGASDKVAPKIPTKQRRDSVGTRERILEIAGTILGRDGPEGLSVSEVASLAGVNRGTAYHHFHTREELLDATMQWISDRLCRELFPSHDPDHWVPEMRPREVNNKLADFMMANPEFGAAWVQSVVIKGRFDSDPFWKMFSEQLKHFAESDRAQPDIDAEVHAFMIVLGVMLWPHWVNANAKSKRQRTQMSERFKKESMRLARSGMLRPGVV